MNSLPSATRMYKALLERDSSFEGIFYVGVKTTGIFCRPTCGAKKPRKENVEFFSKSHDALYAGYRPCLKCKPMDGTTRPPQIVARLRKMVEQEPSGKFADADLQRMGVDPSTARRQFKRYYGMTFHAYHRARRMGLALREVRNGESVIGVQLNHGFDSASGFWDAFRKVFGTPPSRAGEVTCLLARWIETPLGAMLALASDDGLHLLEFVDRRGLEREILALRRRTKSVIIPGSNRHLKQINIELDEYFTGRRTDFTVPLIVEGSVFEQKVWLKLRNIPFGETWSYARLAKAVGKPGAVRAVGSANGRNTLGIVIPCHRVIRSDGTLAGYGGGVWRKQRLIDQEKECVLRAAGGRKNHSNGKSKSR